MERYEAPPSAPYYVIPEEHTLHEGLLLVAPGEYIAKPDEGDWYPLKAEVLERDFDILGPVENEQ